jgi:hypothetical protein
MRGASEAEIPRDRSLRERETEMETEADTRTETETERRTPTRVSAAMDLDDEAETGGSPGEEYLAHLDERGVSIGGIVCVHLRQACGHNAQPAHRLHTHH